ncbi:MAG: signal peptidase I [Verrucomicrobia bacterium]|jgi:signal peptidase I|nr:signal peptidase I [Verrucomicrobiota bacterium]MBT7066680.1 signal peptidase I [Verrucomicrobiota bacterium]
MSILRKRRVRKEAHELLRHATHVRNMREDILEPTQAEELKSKQGALFAAVKSGSASETESATEVLSEALQRIAPAGKGGGLRENFEIIVVAVAVAMGLRAYFIQPFKIPTGSMQPTLFGIHSVEQKSPELLDRFPLKLAKFAVTGEWYSERRAKATGTLGFPTASPTDPSIRIYTIAGKRHKIPIDSVDVVSRGRYELKFRPGDSVKKGDLLWSGVVTRGDHVFVNKVIWNFRKPRRGEIMVFNTTDIAELPQGTHYIKRMCGLPGEQVAIHPPHLVINQNVMDAPEQIARIARRDPGYDGYKLQGKLTSPTLEWPLREGEYFAMGDNTSNSRDSRYWGPVPVRNLVGPAAVVYWPLSKRWGLAD